MGTADVIGPSAVTTTPSGGSRGRTRVRAAVLQEGGIHVDLVALRPRGASVGLVQQADGWVLLGGALQQAPCK